MKNRWYYCVIADNLVKYTYKKGNKWLYKNHKGIAGTKKKTKFIR